MSETIVAAIVGGLFTLVAALLTAYRDNIVAMFGRRHRKVQGHWRGTTSERMLPASRKVWLEGQIEMDFKQSARKLWGVLYGTTNHGLKYHMKIRGQMEDNNFVTLQAHAASPQELNFGMLVLELGHKGRKLTGYGLANGFEKHGISLATVELEKVD